MAGGAINTGGGARHHVRINSCLGSSITAATHLTSYIVNVGITVMMMVSL